MPRATALAMTVVVEGWSFCFALGRHWQPVGGGSAARPTGNGAKTYHQKAKPLKLCINGPDICKKTFDSPKKMCYVNQVQGSDEDTPR